jgi:hypothetical protein
MVSPWKGTGLVLKICKYAIPPFAMKAVKLLTEIGFVVHEKVQTLLSERRDRN